MKLTSARAAVALLAALALSACGGERSGGAGRRRGSGGEPEQGGTAVIAVLSDFQAFNPVTNTHLTSDDVIKHMLFTPLIQYDEELNPQPWLAERWELSDTSVTFHLRGDVRWHDGPR
jgi:peptide/nickel transport system substrate-binding protein